MKNFNNDKNKSILFVSQSFYPGVGGVSTLLLNLSHYLAELNYKIYAIHFEILGNSSTSQTLGYPIREYIISRSEIPQKVFQGYACFKEEIYQLLHGLKVFRHNAVENIPGYRDFLFCSELFSKHLLDVVADKNIDIIHFQDYQVMLGLAAVPLEVRSVFSLYAPLLDNLDKRIAKWLIRYGSKSDKMILSIPQYSRAAIKYGLNPKKSAILPPIIDKEVMNREAELPGTLGQIPEDAVVITYIQRFDSKSGQEQLIRAFSKVSDEYPNSYLVLVGGGSFTDSISNIRKDYFLKAENLVRKLNLVNKVIFTGNIDYMKLSQVYKRSDIVAMLSKMECFGLAVTEAMFHGKPVLVTSVGGLAYQVKNGVNGYIVSPEDIDTTAKLLGQLIRSKELRIKMGREGKEIFQKNFDPEEVIRNYHDLYRSLLSPSILHDSFNYDYLYNSLR